MKVVWLFVFAAVVAQCSAFSAAHDDEAALDLFEKFVAQYGKTYPTEEERNLRFSNFKATLQRAAAKTVRNPLASYGVNFYADLSPEEFKKFHSLRRDNRQSAEKRLDPEFEPKPTFPQAWDWRSHGAVTYVKNQQQCGSCWAFSTTGAIESSWFLAGHNLTAVSEQEIVSCDPNDDGCDGGDPGSAMDWLVQSEGGWITSEKDYPYTSGGGDSGSCHLPKPKAVQIYSHYNVASDEKTMAEYLQAKGPLSICVDASSWQDYNGGILSDCGDNVDHCVLAVGYNLEHNPPYWIVKNSWGVSWGLEGYLYVEYGSNQCDLDSEPRKALVKQAGPTPPPTPAPPPTPRPPVPPPTPSPPGPTKGEFWQYWCDENTCDLSKCKKKVFKQNVCLVNPDGISLQATCESKSGMLRLVLFQNSQDCSGSSVTQNEDLNECIMSDDNFYLYNVCPSASSASREGIAKAIVHVKNLGGEDRKTADALFARALRSQKRSL